eukprot:TRINITY_DN4941_c0_g1_i1.p1 TRINITY_DN4941_c0_g1~~TRINITY_DN4941_c0_g1_i1.p1  ORF type:complete len:138 (-),score=29.77 TRINITY_DN4941_c0_g1_i1:158-571(-)
MCIRDRVSTQSTGSITKGGKAVADAAKASSTSIPSCLAMSKDGKSVRIEVLAKPGSKQNNITDLGSEAGIQIAAPPREGEANEELVSYVADVLGLKKREVVLQTGSKSRNKILVVEGLSIERVNELLQAERDRCKNT